MSHSHALTYTHQSPTCAQQSPTCTPYTPGTPHLSSLSCFVCAEGTVVLTVLSFGKKITSYTVKTENGATENI